MSEKPRLIFRDSQGRSLSLDDLEGLTGQVRWEVVAADTATPEARLLHEQGRILGSRGEHRLALELLERAHALAPAWPYPVYDAAFTYVLMGDAKRAAALYAKVDAMAPRGFCTAKTSLHILTRELRGELPEGFCRAFVMLEWMDDPLQKRAILQSIVARYPDFAPAWKELCVMGGSAEDVSTAIDRGLAGRCDGETFGMLRLNKALDLERQGDPHAAIEMLVSAALDPDSTLATELLAKFALRNLAQHGALDG